MDAPPPDDRDARAPRPAVDDPRVTRLARFLTAGGVVSLTEWRAMTPEDQLCYALAGHLVARDRSALLAEEIVALAQPREAPSGPADPVVDAAWAALKAGS